MQSWDLQVSPTFVLCNSAPESRDHLFFTCTFSWQLWEPLAIRCDLTPSPMWPVNIDYLKAQSGPTWKQKLTLIVWQLVIYTIWHERNERTHRQFFRSPASLASTITRIVKNKIHSSREIFPHAPILDLFGSLTRNSPAPLSSPPPRDHKIHHHRSSSTIITTNSIINHSLSSTTITISPPPLTFTWSTPTSPSSTLRFLRQLHVACHIWNLKGSLIWVCLLG